VFDMGDITLVNVDSIIVDLELYPRYFSGKAPNLFYKARDYRDKMEAGAQFPPVILGAFQGQLILVDGLHRLEAVKQLGKNQIAAEIHSYNDLAAIFLDAVKYNASHGKAFSIMDRSNIAAKAERFGIQDQDIIALLQCTPRTYREVFGDRLVEIDGEKIPASSAHYKLLKQNVITRDQLAEITSDSKHSLIISRNVNHVFKQLTDLVTDHAVDWSSKQIKRHVEYLTPHFVKAYEAYQND
jgi:hypothetical protein